MYEARVTATIKKAEPVMQPPDMVTLTMPRDIAQGLFDIASRIQTNYKLGECSYQIYKALSAAGFRRQAIPRICLTHVGGNIQFIDDE